MSEALDDMVLLAPVQADSRTIFDKIGSTGTLFVTLRSTRLTTLTPILSLGFAFTDYPQGSLGALLSAGAIAYGYRKLKRQFSYMSTYGEFLGWAEHQKNQNPVYRVLRPMGRIIKGVLKTRYGIPSA